VEDKECAGRPKLVEELKALLDKDLCQTQEELGKQNYWELLNQPFPCI